MKKLFALTVLLSSISFVIYLLFYDILIPGLPGGSYRQAVGSLFAIPSLLLLLGQVGIGGLIILFAVSSIKKEKLSRDAYAKCLFTSSVITFLFAFTYVIYPLYGPFYYIVFATGAAPPGVLLVEIVWTAVMLSLSTLMISKINKIRFREAFAVAAITIIFIIVAAS